MLRPLQAAWLAAGCLLKDKRGRSGLPRAPSWEQTVLPLPTAERPQLTSGRTPGRRDMEGALGSVSSEYSRRSLRLVRLQVLGDQLRTPALRRGHNSLSDHKASRLSSRELIYFQAKSIPTRPKPHEVARDRGAACCWAGARAPGGELPGGPLSPCSSCGAGSPS